MIRRLSRRPRFTEAGYWNGPVPFGVPRPYRLWEPWWPATLVRGER